MLSHKTTHTVLLALMTARLDEWHAQPDPATSRAVAVAGDAMAAFADDPAGSTARLSHVYVEQWLEVLALGAIAAKMPPIDAKAPAGPADRNEARSVTQVAKASDLPAQVAFPERENLVDAVKRGLDAPDNGFRPPMPRTERIPMPIVAVDKKDGQNG